MRDNKGQALVEFILVLPVLLFAVIAFIDVASLFYSKYQLEQHLDAMVMLYEEGKKVQLNQYALQQNVQLRLQENATFAIIKIEKQEKMNTPFLKKYLSKIETERTVYLHETE